MPTKKVLSGPGASSRFSPEEKGEHRPAGGRCIHHAFEAQVARRPDAVAVVSGAEALTYAELEARSNRLARALIRRGAGPEVRVGICVERSAELVVGLLGILKAGAAYVPLDPSYPRERIATTLEDARAPLLVAQARFRPLLAGHTEGALWLDADREEIESESAERPECRAGSRNLAYLIYTSGSTGRPKGVMIEHASALALLAWCRETWGPEECAGVLGSTSVCFDMSVFEVFHTLALGGKILMADNALALPSLPAREEVTLVNTVPSAAAELVRSGGLPPSVRVVNLGGEPLKNALAQALYAREHVEAVHNLYGPTEDTTYSTFLRVARGAEREPTVGHAVAGTRVYVLDEGLDPVPGGEAGEVYLGGAGVTRGYLGQPGMTAEKFLPDPLSPEPGARMYRVGDLGRVLPGGELEYLGRRDHQVKIRGFRVELGEIESVLLEHAGVRDAVVTAREDRTGDRRLVAYVVADGEGAGAGELREHVRERLPEYMLPGAFVFLEALPLLPNGKVDRHTLPEPGFTSAEREAGHVAPRTPTEECLAAVWSEVLGVERVGVHEDFFDLGGHSLRVAQVVARLREALRVELPMAALFDAPTIAQLAEKVDAGVEAAELPPMLPVPREGPLPLSLSQEAIWFFQELAPGMQSYNFQCSFRFRGALDTDALERTLTEIVRRHEIFRTTFAEVDGQPVQVIHPPFAVALPPHDLRGLPEAEREAEVERHMGEEFGTPFDLSRLPLIRWRLLRLADDEHALLQVEHHFVHDGWSFAVLLREITAIYAAFARGEPSPLPELPVQFADFAVWHRELMRGERARADLAYWKEKLTGADPVLELPTDFPRPPAISFRGSSIRTRIPPRVVRAARAFGRERGVTLYMTLMSAFQALMQRYTGQEDFCVGGGVANRSWRESEPLIGMIVNTIALRTRLGRVSTFDELVRQVRGTAREAYAHKDVHFGQVVEAVQPERSLSHLPIYQVTFNFHDSRYPDFGLPGVEMEVTEGLSNGSAKFDLQVITMPRAEMRPGAPEDLVESIWEYSTDLFERSTVERIIRHYHLLLEAALADPDARLATLPLLSAPERERIEQWNATAHPHPHDRLVHRMVEAAAARAPGALAVGFEGVQLTYAELDRRANRLAHFLRKRGVGPEARVGVCLERGPELVVSLLAVLRAGSAYVPLDPAYPAERIEYMLRDSGARILLTSSEPAGSLSAEGVATVCVDAEREALAAESAEPPAVELSRESLAYVIYTSGSTGTPKGVAVTHAGLLNLVEWHRSAFTLTAADRTTLVAGVAFDASAWEVWPSLAVGACLHVPAGEVRLSPERLRDWLVEREVTVCFLPTPLAESVLSLEWPRETALRVLLTGGDALRAHPRPGLPFALVNDYGPTECTVVATSGAVPPREGPGRAPSIGRPVANTRAYVLDSGLEPLPVGVPGELYVGGEGVARGYLGRAALTAERFVPDPFGGERGRRMYRTGDRVRWLASGELEFLGRVDRQVKVRGFRIEPGEIEAALLLHPAVREAAVVVDGGARERRLVGYVAAEESARLDAGELRSRLGERLPEYMVPSALVVLDSLPLTPNGKLDRSALPAPEREAAEEHVAPRTPREEILAGIWSEVLGVERIGSGESFFALGGHSLLATRVASRVRKAFGVDLPLRTLFEHPTLAELAARIETEQAASVTAELPPLRRAPREGALPLSHAQERLWVVHRLEPESAAYNVRVLQRLRGPLDVEALRRALEAVVERHESLRTTFPDAGDGPVQAIAPFGGFSLSAPEPSGATEEEALRWARAFVEDPMELGAGPLFRAALLPLEGDGHLLALAAHHAVFDGWSLKVLFRELGALYRAFSRGEPSPLAELPFQYADYAVWQREWLRGELLERQLAYWRERLAGAAPLLELPTDRPRPLHTGGRRGTVSFTLPEGLGTELRALSRREGATLFMTLLAAWQALLARYGGQEDVLVGTPTAGREQVELEGLIGFFGNTLVLRADLSGDPTARELLGRVRESALGAYQNADVPFERLVDELGVERSLSHTPLFQVVFTLETAPAHLELGEVRAEPVAADDGTAKFDVIFRMRDEGTRLSGELAYRTELFEAETVERMAEHLRTLLEGMAAHPERRLSGIPLLGSAERSRVLGEWNATGRAYPVERCVHELFAEQARRTPDAVAVESGDELLTYAELERRSAQLARHLAGLGAGPEARVGICLERSAALVVGVLGVLRAGAAYVALDPGQPDERLRLVLEDAGATVVLTQESLAGRFGTHGGAVVRLDADREAIARHPAEPPVVELSPESLCYVIYTSGSTGTPKGALVTHGGLGNYLHFFDREILAEEGFRLPLVSRLSFDAHVRQLFPPLLRGEAVWVLPEESVGDPGRLLEALGSRERVSFGGVPSLWGAVLDALDAGEHPAPRDLRAVLLGGEALPAELVRRTLERFPGVRIWNHYGPTEATVNTTVARVESPERVTLGGPVANVRVYVLDAHGAPSPVGVPGEAYVAGAGVSRGYLGRPEMTAERFLPDPFSSEPGGRMYRTGDRVRWLASGELEFLGRVDQQVKVRGFRIEPGEVEAALERHPAVREAVVVAREDAPGEVRLVAYVVPEEEAGAEGLREYLGGILPEYMVPSAFVPLDAFPLTPNGKVDRRALPAPEHGSTEAYVAPRTRTEVALAGIWAEVLEVERVGVHDHFFDLGGHSLRATQVVARVREALGVELPLRAVFEAQSLAGLAARVDALVPAGWEETEFAAALDRLDGLSEEEILRFLDA